ncbi:MAG: tRNA lysidine(34) synthetase TilS [Planctomycetota bacterium]
MRELAYHGLLRGLTVGLRRRCGVRSGDALLVAVSGGADSVALLRALHGLAGRRRWGLRLVVGHVQHHLRGDDAEGDAEFVAGLADGLGLACLRRDLDPTGWSGNVEESARDARYAALHEMAVEAGCGLVVTAHHADDQLETLLMRIARGTGVEGLRGIAWRRGMGEWGVGLCEGIGEATCPGAEPGAKGADGGPWLVRPMLGVTRAVVLDYLERLGQGWREDASNGDVSRARARLRAEVLPGLRALNPRVAEHAVALADRVRDGRRQGLSERSKAMPSSPSTRRH